jgi:hypothetical protein
MKEVTMPVREVSNRGRNVIGRFPSIKMARMIAFESLIERDFIYLLDHDPEVTWFEEQPLTIPYHQEGRAFSYTPDFHLVEGDRHVLVECKPDRFVDKEENRRKFAAARGWCAQQGWVFRIVTGEQVRAGHRLQNVKLLTRYARQMVDPTVRGRVLALLGSSRSAMTIGDVARAISDEEPGPAKASILCMAFHHEIFVPLDKAPLSRGTPVCLPLPLATEVQT